jgi:hypothetical protein
MRLALSVLRSYLELLAGGSRRRGVMREEGSPEAQNLPHSFPSSISYRVCLLAREVIRFFVTNSRFILEVAFFNVVARPDMADAAGTVLVNRQRRQRRARRKANLMFPDVGKKLTR